MAMAHGVEGRFPFLWHHQFMASSTPGTILDIAAADVVLRDETPVAA